MHDSKRLITGIYVVTDNSKAINVDNVREQALLLGQRWVNTVKVLLSANDRALERVTWFEDLRSKTRYFYLKPYAVFVLLNLSCYWWALLTAYPKHVFGSKSEEYILMGFPVAVLGALFDCFSLLITIYIIKKAINSKSNSSYILYLCDE